MSEPHPEFSALDLDDPVVTSLLFKQAVTMEQVDRAWRSVKHRNENPRQGTLWRALAEDPTVSRERVFGEAAGVSGFARVDVDAHAARATIDRFAGSIPEREWKMLVDLQVVPIEYNSPETDRPDRIVLASHDPSRPEVARLLRRLDLSDCEVRYAPHSDLSSLLNYTAAVLGSGVRDDVRDTAAVLGSGVRGDVRDDAFDGRIDTMLEEFLTLAVRESATAIHVRPGETGIRIGLRIDGALVPWIEQPDVAIEEILTTFKTAVAGTACASAPAATYRQIDGRRMRFSLSVLPIEGGEGYESVVVRIDEEPMFDLSDIELAPSVFEDVHDVLRRGGMIVVASPDESGGTSMAAALAREMVSAGAVVAAVDAAKGGDGILSIRRDGSVELPDMLEAISRHDVDVVLLPPAANRCEAEAALSLALNGRVVITPLNASTLNASTLSASTVNPSTLNAPTVRGVIDAFTRLGVDRAVSAHAIELVLAQQRLRVLCSDCRVPSEHVDAEYLQYLGFTRAEAEGGTFYDVADGDACTTCGGSGYSGTTLLAAVTRIRPDVCRKISLGSDEYDEFEASASIVSQARALAAAGASSLRELVRVSAFSPYSASPPRSR